MILRMIEVCGVSCWCYDAWI